MLTGSKKEPRSVSVSSCLRVATWAARAVVGAVTAGARAGGSGDDMFFIRH